MTRSRAGGQPTSELQALCLCAFTCFLIKSSYRFRESITDEEIEL